MRYTNIKPVSWIEEKIRLIMYYHPRGLIVLMLLVLVFCGVGYWYLSNPPYRVHSQTCNIEISYPEWVLPNTKYEINWIVSGDARVKVKSNTPLVVILNTSERNATFEAKPGQQKNYSAQINVVVLSDTKECTISLKVMVMGWYPVLRAISQIFALGSLIITLMLGIKKLFDVLLNI